MKEKPSQELRKLLKAKGVLQNSPLRQAKTRLGRGRGDVRDPVPRRSALRSRLRNKRCQGSMQVVDRYIGKLVGAS